MQELSTQIFDLFDGRFQLSIVVNDEVDVANETITAVECLAQFVGGVYGSVPPHCAVAFEGIELGGCAPCEVGVVGVILERGQTCGR